MPDVSFKDLCIDVTAGEGRPAAVGAFWAKALDQPMVVHDDGDIHVGPPEGGSKARTIWINSVPEPITAKSRAHIDMRVADGDPSPLMQAGGTLVRSPDDDIDWHIVNDPDGVPVCMLGPHPADPTALGPFELVVDAVDPQAIASWWAERTGGTVASRAGAQFVWIEGAAGFPYMFWVFNPVPEPKTVKNRVHWDVKLVDTTIDGLVAAGATLLRPKDDEIRWWVMADPEGNEFRVRMIPQSMTAVLLTGYGGFDRLEIHDDVAVPQPDANEVLVKSMSAAGVNNTDIKTRIGWYAPDALAPTATDGDAAVPTARTDVGWSGNVPAFPRIQGADACGRIVAVGPGVEPSRVGERIIVEPVFRDPADQRSQPVYFGSEVDGALAEYTVVPSRHAIGVECSWTNVELASIPCSYSAAENMLGRAKVTAGETVIVTGASGGVGSAAIQLAKRRGAHVVAVAAPAKHDEVRTLGPDMVLPRDCDLTTALGPHSVDVVIDVVGGPSWPQLLAVLRRGGRYATSGAIAGHWVELDLRTLYLNDLTLFGCTVLDADVFANLVGYIERGEIRPLVAATFPLREIVAAQRIFLTKQHVGKIVLTVGNR